MAVTAGLLRAAPTAVYAVAGEGGQRRITALELEPGIRCVASPRQASVLLVAGTVPERAHPALCRLHDQMAHPRATLVWGEASGPLARTDVVAVDSDTGESPSAVARLLRRLQEDVFTGRRPSSEAWLPDEPPALWRGRGDHGQGGEGMMGGRPYGRPMTMPDDDLRDGLSLDAHPVTIGPFAPMLPAGMELTVTLQGDVIQSVEIERAPFADPTALGPFERALETPTSPARLERLRAAHHLDAVARLLQVRGLRAAAWRWHYTAARIRGIDAAAGADSGFQQAQTARVRQLTRRLRWSGLLQGIEPGLATCTHAGNHRLLGPAGRAGGKQRDARAELDPYRRVGFQPVFQSDGDTASRIRQWVAEAVQGMELADQLPDDPITLPDAVETPVGPAGPAMPPAPALTQEDLRRMLVGLEWGQAVTVLASFDVHVLPGVAQGGTE